MTRTLREQMIERLMERALGAGDLSREMGVREKDVYDHLAHVGRTVAAKGRKLEMQPAVCLSCGYTFKDRRRLTPPGRCPRCRQTHLSNPVYRIR